MQSYQLPSPKIADLVTPEMIRRHAYAEMKVKLDTEKARKEADPNYKASPLTITDINDPRWERWLQGRLDDMRRHHRLVTEQQLQDLKDRRPLKEGDKAQFVGASRVEETSTGRFVKRPHGQRGRIVRAIREKDGTWCYWFRPDAPPAAELTKMEICEFYFKETTRGYLEIERIP